MDKLYDVIAVNLSTSKVRIMASGKFLNSANLIVRWSVARRGVDEEIFMTVDGGQYTNGDLWPRENRLSKTQS